MNIDYIDKWHDMPPNEKVKYRHYLHESLQADIYCKTIDKLCTNKYHRQKCIYSLEIDGSIYIGRTNNFRKRILSHLTNIKLVIVYNKSKVKGKKLNKLLQKCHIHIGNTLYSNGGILKIKILSFNDSTIDEKSFIHKYISNKKYNVLNVRI